MTVHEWKDVDIPGRILSLRLNLLRIVHNLGKSVDEEVGTIHTTSVNLFDSWTRPGRIVGLDRDGFLPWMRESKVHSIVGFDMSFGV